MSQRDDQFLPKRLKALNQLERRGASAIKKPSSLELAEKAVASKLPGSEPAFRFVANRLPKRTKKQQKRSVSPLLVVVLILFALPILLFQSLFSPLKQLSARLFDKFNYQEVSINNGMSRIVKNMVDNQPSRYRELNDQRQISQSLQDALRRQDIIIDQDNHHLIFKGQAYQGEELDQALRANYSLIRALNTATGVQRSMFQDSQWQSINRDLGVTARGFDLDRDLSLDEQELQLTRATSAGWRFNVTLPEETEENQQSLANFDTVKDSFKATNQVADQLTKDKQAPINRNLPKLSTLDQQVIQNNSLCGAYHTNNLLKEYQKTDQARQYSKLAGLFIVESEKARLGEIDPNVYEQLNDRLTSTYSYTDDNGQIITTKPATDSYAWQMLNDAVSTPPDTNAEKYVIGANQTVSKSLSIFDKFTQNTRDSTTKAVCGASQQSGVVGWFFNKIANLFGGPNLSGADSQELAIITTPEAQANASETTLKAMTGLATAPNLAGEDLSNAIISHAGYMYYRSAMSSGAGFLTKAQAANFVQNKQSLVALRSQYEQQSKGPFDASSPYTLMGNLNWKVLPILQSSGFLNGLSKFGAVFRQSLSSLSPVSKATSQNNLINSFDHCLDPDYRAALGDDIALDAFCVPIVGEVSSSTNFSIESIFQQLEESGNLEVIEGSCDANGQSCRTRPVGDLLNYKQNCLNRATIALETGKGSVSLGRTCAIDSPIRELYSPYFTNQRLSPTFKRQLTGSQTLITDTAWPVPEHYNLSSPFGPRIDPISRRISFHNGIDIPAPTGTPVIALEDGTVTVFPFDASSSGYRIDIQAGEQSYLYAHLSKILVENGEAVTKGQVIGEVGSTGYSTGPHLHFEVRINNESIDPMAILNYEKD